MKYTFNLSTGQVTVASTIAILHPVMSLVKN